MRKDLERYYEKFDKKYAKIQKRFKRKNLNPIIFNFDEVPFWYHKKP